MYEMKKSGRYGIGFIDPNTINEYTWNLSTCRDSLEESMFEFFKHLNTSEDILLPYNFLWVILSCTTNFVFAY